MINSRILDQQARAYGWSAVRTLGTVYQYRELLPSEVDGNDVNAVAAFGPYGPNVDLNDHLEIDEGDYKPLVALCVVAHMAAIDGVQIRREDYWTDLIMGTVIDEDEIPEERKIERNLDTWLLDLYRNVRCELVIRPGILRALVDAGARPGTDAKYQALQAAIAAEGAQPTDDQKKLTAAALVGYYLTVARTVNGLTWMQDLFMAPLLSAFTLGTLALFAKSGEMSTAFIGKIKNGAPPNCIVDSICSREDMSRLWKRVSGLCEGVDVDVQQFFDNLTQIFPINVNLRANLTLTQALYSQASSVTIVAQVLRKYPECPVWTYVRTAKPVEYTAWVAAMNALAANPFAAVRFGNQDAHQFEAKNFTTLMAAALTLDMTMDHNSSLRGYGGRPNTPLQARISQICNAYLQRENQALVEADYAVGGVHYWNVAADIPANFLV